MPISQQALDLENLSVGINGKPTLADAYKILKEQWENGEREREIGLHLMFLSWYGLIEPEHLTGFSEEDGLWRGLNQTFTEVHAYFESQIYQDAEMLYAFGLAANLFWFMFDDASEWEKRSIDYKQHYRALEPDGINPEVFHNRGAYGEYYTHQAKIKGGY